MYEWLTMPENLWLIVAQSSYTSYLQKLMKYATSPTRRPYLRSMSSMVSAGPYLHRFGSTVLVWMLNHRKSITFASRFNTAALESLGFASYITEVKDVLQECKTVALKRRKASSRLENLGIPEEELLRQQQELFAKVGSVWTEITVWCNMISVGWHHSQPMWTFWKYVFIQLCVWKPQDPKIPCIGAI